MSGLILLLVVFVGFALLGILALAFGVDSRREFEDPNATVRGLTF